MAKLTFGELDNARSPRVEALLATCTAAGIDAEIADDINLATWQKFAFLVADVGLHRKHAVEPRPDPRQSAGASLPAAT